ncbi:HAMP domain-containing protein [Thiospirochaeta perfilievii]|uniref:HAMP domain-containing protein n=1 Tax=Thiospirochaeta perfilievii TaxID=252967 RepID=A0A5C1Q643_9SPIO|nr:histidine kinase [Thiospirochaeta perfilievii]QEN03445.1 HAMP domain-containing protein [Thiospirochaeta perfilievii]
MIRIIDDYSIRKKFFLLYILCVLLPIVITDSIVIYDVLRTERDIIERKMGNIANAVEYNFKNNINRASEIARSVYINKYIDEFLDRQFLNPLDFFINYQNFFRDTLLDSIVGIDNTIITLYSDNDSIVNGNEFKRIEVAKSKPWYNYLQESGLDKIVYLYFDKSISPAIDAKRKIIFIQKLNYYKYLKREKLVKVELDYSSISRNLTKMSYGATVYICRDSYILLSNGKYGDIGKDFEALTDEIGYTQKINLFGMDFDIVILKPKHEITKSLVKNIQLIIILILINTVLPYILVTMFNKSFTERITKLSEVFKNVDKEELLKIKDVHGKDEIGSLMKKYNRMADRINSLIQIVYKNKIHEQEITVARQNAELLALHSQINPHFLYNVLESIRMHSIVKEEFETANMIEKLSVIQRQNVEWGNDFIEIYKEMEFVKAYLGLQKHRFGDRISYELQVDDKCLFYKIPKLSIVTFIENACIHGIESKMTPGWIFVRIYQEDEVVCLDIEDTGAGMSESMMSEMLNKMRNANIEMLKSNSRVGIVNACLRINMISGNSALYELDGEEGSGFIVHIKIPHVNLK